MATATPMNGRSANFVAPTGGVAVNTFYLVENTVVYSLETASAAATFLGMYDGEVIDAPKATGTGQSFAAGDFIYFDASSNNFTTTATGNTLCGRALEAATTAATTMRVRIGIYA